MIDSSSFLKDSSKEIVLNSISLRSSRYCASLYAFSFASKEAFSSIRETGFSFLARLEENVEGFKTASLEYNHRHSIVGPILEVYKTFRD